VSNCKESPGENLIAVTINVQIDCGKSYIFAMPRNKCHFSIFMGFRKVPSKALMIMDFSLYGSA
jgi:hypothetical protein